MLQACFDCYGSYTTDSVYQWDLNRRLAIHGLDYDSAPAIHFSNKKSTEALVVQSTIEDGVIYCDVPNILLQEPYDIVGYVCECLDQELTTHETIRIPVKPRVKPADYAYSDNVEILTYYALMSEITSVKASTEKDLKSMDASKANKAELNAVKVEVETAHDTDIARVEDEIASERARIDQLVASPEMGEGDFEKELEDVRIDTKGTTHGSAGTAVRAQIQELDSKIDDSVNTLSSEIEEIKSIFFNTEYVNDWELGVYVNGSGLYSSSTNRAVTKHFINGKAGDIITVSGDYEISVVEYDGTNYKQSLSWSSGYLFTENRNVLLIIQRKDTNNITVAEISNVVTFGSFHEIDFSYKNGLLNLERGNIASGVLVDSTLVVRNATFMYADYPIQITLTNSSMWLAWDKYDYEGNYIKSIDAWNKSGALLLESGYAYKIRLKYSDDSIINESIAIIESYLTVEYCKDNNSGIYVGKDITENIQKALNDTKQFVLLDNGYFYISNTIKIPSNAYILLGAKTELILSAGINKPMFENENPNGNSNITIRGGIYNSNNTEQAFDTNKLFGMFRFSNITNFVFERLCIKNPISFGTQFCGLNNFRIKDIHLEYNLANLNMDGIHLHGECYNGYIGNIFGDTTDDLVALNGNDALSRMCNDLFSTQMVDGDIKNVVVDRIHSSDGYRGIRLLSTTAILDNIHIKNVSGVYEHAVILIGIFNGLEGNGKIGRVNIENVNAIATSDEGTVYVLGNSDYIKVKDINVDCSNYNTVRPIIFVANGYSVKNLFVDTMHLIDSKNGDTVILSNNGTIDTLRFYDFISDSKKSVVNNGTINNTLSNWS